MEQQKNAVTGIRLLEMGHGIVQIPDGPGQVHVHDLLARWPDDDDWFD